MLSLVGKQCYQDQEPEVMELVTEGVMEFTDGGWDISGRDLTSSESSGVGVGREAAA